MSSQYLLCVFLFLAHLLSKVRWLTATLNIHHQNPPFTAFLNLAFFQTCTASFSLASFIFLQPVLVCSEKMQLHISPSLRHVTVLPGKGVREFIKVKIWSRRVSYRMLFYSLLFFTFLLRFVFVLTTVDTIDGEAKCSTIGSLTFFWAILFNPKPRRICLQYNLTSKH